MSPKLYCAFVNLGQRRVVTVGDPEQGVPAMQSGIARAEPDRVCEIGFCLFRAPE